MVRPKACKGPCLKHAAKPHVDSHAGVAQVWTNIGMTNFKDRKTGYTKTGYREEANTWSFCKRK